MRSNLYSCESERFAIIIEDSIEAMSLTNDKHSVIKDGESSSLSNLLRIEIYLSTADSYWLNKVLMSEDNAEELSIANMVKVFQKRKAS